MHHLFGAVAVIRKIQTITIEDGGPPLVFGLDSVRSRSGSRTCLHSPSAISSHTCLHSPSAISSLIHRVAGPRRHLRRRRHGLSAPDQLRGSLQHRGDPAGQQPSSWPPCSRADPHERPHRSCRLTVALYCRWAGSLPKTPRLLGFRGSCATAFLSLLFTAFPRCRLLIFFAFHPLTNAVAVEVRPDPRHRDTAGLVTGDGDLWRGPASGYENCRQFSRLFVVFPCRPVPKTVTVITAAEMGAAIVTGMQGGADGVAGGDLSAPQAAAACAKHCETSAAVHA